MPRLSRLLFALLVLCASHCARSETDYVIAIRGSASFASALKKYPLLFIKFFHPDCSHCQAAKKPYDDLAAMFSERNTSLQFAEVDASSRANKLLIEEHAAGFPTFKLFIRTKLAGEYGGVRSTSDMAAYLDRQLRADQAPLITPIRSERDVTTFLATHGDGPFVLALNDTLFLEQIQELKLAARYLHEATMPPVKFGLLKSAAYLVPEKARDQFRKANVYAQRPFAVAARNRDSFVSAPQYWFPDVMGGDSLFSFAAVATLPIDGTALLTPKNVRAVSASNRPILYAFGARSSPSMTLAEELGELAKYGAEDLVVVYGRDLDFEPLRAHLGLPDIAEEQRTIPRSSYFVLYRTGNAGAYKNIYNESMFGSKKAWLEGFYTSHGKAPERFGVAGQVFNLNSSNWSALLDHDGRAVVLAVHKPGCVDCVGFRRIIAESAEFLRPYFRRVVVAAYNASEGSFPAFARFKMPVKLPYLGLVLPGRKPTELLSPDIDVIVETTLRAVKQQPKPVVKVKDPRLANLITYIAGVFIAAGFAVAVRRRARTSRYASLARIRRASKSV